MSVEPFGDAEAEAAAASYLSLVPPLPESPRIVDWRYFGEQIGAASLCLRLAAIYTVAHDEFAARRLFKCDSNAGRLRLIATFASEDNLLLDVVME